MMAWSDPDFTISLQAKLTLQQFDIQSDDRKAPIFSKLAEKWLRCHIKPTKRQTTHDRYGSLLKMHLNPMIGNKPIHAIRRADVIGTLRVLQAKGLCRSVIELARNVISGVCEFAIDEEYINENPTTGVIRRVGLQRRRDREPVTAFNRNEIEKILEKCRSYRPDWHSFFFTAFRTGMRLGELLALQWQDVNWNERYVLVQRSFRNGRTTPPKNGKALRVDMTGQLYELLKKFHLKRKQEALKAGRSEPPAIIFHTHGRSTSQNTVRNIWRKLLKKSGIEYRKFHTVRHTIASVLISNGESVAYVKELMGHSSIQITCDIYGHLLPSENKSTLDALDTHTYTPGAPAEKIKAVTF